MRFRQGAVTGVDWDARTVAVADQPDLPFDHLVLAGGATVTYFGTPGAAEHGFPLYTLEDATRLRNHIVRRFEAADTDPTELDRGGLTFVVVGGGPTGVETAGALAELFSMVFRKDYPGPRREPGPGRAGRDAGPPAPPVHGVEPAPRPRSRCARAAWTSGSAPRSRPSAPTR